MKTIAVLVVLVVAFVWWRNMQMNAATTAPTVNAPNPTQGGQINIDGIGAADFVDRTATQALATTLFAARVAPGSPISAFKGAPPPPPRPVALAAPQAHPPPSFGLGISGAVSPGTIPFGFKPSTQAVPTSWNVSLIPGGVVGRTVVQ